MQILDLQCQVTTCQVTLSSAQVVDISKQSAEGFTVGDFVTISDGIICKMPCEAPPIVPEHIHLDEPKPVRGLW